jgi:hypothetical protein
MDQHAVIVGTRARHRGHDHAVGQGVATDLDLRKERIHYGLLSGDGAIIDQSESGIKLVKRND